jgi:DNA processing protein
MFTGTSTELTAWLCLDGVPGIGPIKGLRLLSHGSPQQLCQLDPLQLRQLGLSATQAEALLHPDQQRIADVLSWADKPGRHVICCLSAQYPPWLREIPAAPLLLFVEGNVDLLASTQIAMVGTRNPTQSGRGMAATLSRELVAAGLVITSGLALGIDAVCHQAALQNQGQTIAVLGSGLRHCYPQRHYLLASEIVAQGGTVLSELWPDVLPRAENFPRRNRIISGLALGTVVVEAAARSGSLITARYALEQGREVFAVPGAVQNPAAAGCLHLIQQGAKLVCSAADILEEIDIHLADCNVMRQESLLHVEGLPSSSLLDNVGFETTAIDVVVQLSRQPVERVIGELLELELAGWITSVPGGYVRTRRD